jgi:hypothetical protein
LRFGDALRSSPDLDVERQLFGMTERALKYRFGSDPGLRAARLIDRFPASS